MPRELRLYRLGGALGYDSRVPEEFGSYLILEQLGVGGMASVHLAESKSVRKRVALKRLLEHAAEQPDLVEAFVHEARLARFLHHANIAQTFDFGKVEGTYFIAMEFVSGPTLAQLTRQCNATVGMIPIPIILNILCQICDALDHAHNCTDESGQPLHIVHRDVSPPNLIISNSGMVKLIDFGLAKAMTSRQTQAGVIKGKFSYVAPEYLKGKLDARADLWALGVVAHELLTGERLFDANDDFKTLDRVRDMTILPPSQRNAEVPHDLDDIVLTALERDPARRWQSAGAMRNALDGVAKQLGRITNQVVLEWVEWAFEQRPGARDQSGVSQLIAMLEQPSKPTVRAKAKTPLALPRVGAAMLTRRKSRRTAVLVALLVVVAAGAAASWYFDLPRYLLSP